MILKPVVACSPLLLCLLCGTARADLEPFSFGASETVTHDDNLDRTSTNRISDWYSTTELHGALSQPLGRDTLTANAGVNYSAYRNEAGVTDLSDRNSVGYRGAVGLAWSTIGDLSGSLGADTNRHQYFYGVDGELQSTQGRNLETDNHAYAKVNLGGPSRWNIFAGFDANSDSYSAASFRSNEVRQWQQSVGTTYSTSPDLSFGVTGTFLHGEYPHYTADGAAQFSSRTIAATTRYQASGVSSLSANLGYTTEDSDLQPTQGFVSGGLNWNWAPPSHFNLNVGISRSMNGGGATTSLTDVNDRALNTTGTFNLTYLATAKISLVGGAQYTQRKYDNVQVPDYPLTTPATYTTANGSNHLTRFSLSVHYQPTRTTDLNCGAARERQTPNSAQLGAITPSYTDNTVFCSAAISFD